MSALLDSPPPQTAPPAGADPSRPRKLLGLQYVRAVAAVGVVVFHAAWRAGFHFGVGEARIDLFFVLSGFMLWTITNERTRPLGFLVDRAKRVVPSYWIVTAVLIFGALAGLFPRVRLTAGHILQSLFFIPHVSPSNGRVWPLLVPGWTLNYEVGFYLLFAACLLLPRRHQLHLLSAILGFAVLCGTAFHPAGTLLRFYTDSIVLEFAAGAWLAVLWRRKGDWNWVLGWPLLIGASAWFLLASLSDWHVPRAVRFGLPAVLAVLSVLWFERGPRRVPRWKFPELLGDASYSIYLWHTLAISVVGKFGTQFKAPPILIMLGGTVGGILLGLAAYKTIEQPLVEFFKRRKQLARTAAVPTTPTLSTITHSEVQTFDRTIL